MLFTCFTGTKAPILTLDTALKEALALKGVVAQETEALKEQLARKDTAATEALTLQTGLLALLVQTYCHKSTSGAASAQGLCCREGVSTFVLVKQVN